MHTVDPNCQNKHKHTPFTAQKTSPSLQPYLNTPRTRLIK